MSVVLLRPNPHSSFTAPRALSCLEERTGFDLVISFPETLYTQSVLTLQLRCSNLLHFRHSLPFKFLVWQVYLPRERKIEPESYLIIF